MTIRCWLLLTVVVILTAVGCEEPVASRPGSLVAVRRVPPTTEVWVASEMTALTEATPRFDDREILSRDGKTVLLTAGANETVSFQIVVDAPAGGLPSVRVLPDALQTADKKLTLPAETVRLFRVLPVEVTEFPAWYLRLVDHAPVKAGRYDPLVPVNSPRTGQPYRLGRGERLAIWADLAVPRNAHAGIYRGAIRVDTGAGGYRFDVELIVRDYVLPDARPFAAVGGFSHEAIFREFYRRDGKPYVPTRLDTDDPKIAQALDLLRDMVVLAHEHRLDLFDKNLQPDIHRDEQGRLKLNWTHYDKIVKPLLDGSAFADRVGLSAWPIPYNDAWPTPKYYGGFDSPTYRTTAVDVVAKAGRHFRSLGAEDQIFAWPYRGEVNAGAFGHFEKLAAVLRQGDKSIPILATLPIAPPKISGWVAPKNLDESIDILAPAARWLDPRQAAARRTPEHPLAGVWLAPGDVPYLPALSVIASPSDVRALPWFAAKYQCTGLFLPEVLHWNGDVFHTPAGAETRLFYPGARLGLRSILPSVRLKRLRRGLQDTAYLWILRQRRREGLARAINDAMVRYACLDAAGDNYLDPRLDGWVKDSDVWIQAHRLLAEEVDQAVHPSPRTEQDRLADQVRWRRFTEQTSRITAERVQTFVRGGDLPLSDIPETPDRNVRNLRATVLASLYNEFDRPLETKVKITSLPEGWETVIGEYTIPRFAPGARRDAKLVVEGLDVPVTPDGKIPLTLEVQTEPNPPQTLRTEVAFIVAGRFNTPPTIDGKLDDWPTRPRASAGNFRLLGRRGQTADGLAKRRTTAFAMHDEKHLYFAFRCEEPDPDGMIVHNDNLARYEQLLACGEDLVEILLDPGAKAAGPEDLYHLLVKPNAATVQEIGVRTDPPLGRTRPFPLGARVAVARRKDYWSVEIAIPRDAFGADGAESFWGVNFTRFAPRELEASSWSGASRYFYDPRSLGTMYLPPSEHRIIPN
ncbi:MAG: DUF4091 domain-containing protein [Phycisphaerae bacterium]|nr:DUF4091 domain-containing protein [Phycisphaerae bacterium]